MSKNGISHWAETHFIFHLVRKKIKNYPEQSMRLQQISIHSMEKSYIFNLSLFENLMTYIKWFKKNWV